MPDVNNRPSAYDLLTDKLSSRNFLLGLLRKRVFGGKRAALREAEAFACAIWPYQTVARRLSRRDGDIQKTGVGLYGQFHAETGVGQSVRRAALSFQSTNYPISCHAITETRLFEEKVPFNVSRSLQTRFDTVLLHLNADALLALAPKLPKELFEKRRVIGFWHWELPVFPARWAAAFDFVDEIWVPSQFVAQSLATATDKPIHIVPHAIPRILVDKRAARSELRLPNDDLLILSTFDSNSWIPRKNIVGTIKAFLDAFPKPTLSSPKFIVKLHGRTQRNEFFDEFLRIAATDDRIIVIDKVYSPEQMAMLQNACDIYLSLHRSEGYGFNIAESMAIGKLAIATNFSGNVDFMNPQNSILIPYVMRAVQPKEYLFGGGQWWAEPSHDAAVEALRIAFENPARAKSLSENGMRDIAFNNSFERVGRISIATLNGESLKDDRSVRGEPGSL